MKTTSKNFISHYIMSSNTKQAYIYDIYYMILPLYECWYSGLSMQDIRHFGPSTFFFVSFSCVL